MGAEVFCLQQLLVFCREAAVGTRRIDSSRQARNHRGILEVTLQTAVICVEKAGAARQGKGYDVFVVGAQEPGLDELVFVLTDSHTPYLPHPAAKPTRFQPPTFEVSIAYQFVQHSATDH